MRITTKKILKEINCKLLTLHNGGGYFYFAYDNEEGDYSFNTERVYCYRLNHLDLDSWVEIGKDFVKECEMQ
jgi:hypothetical protein